MKISHALDAHHLSADGLGLPVRLWTRLRETYDAAKRAADERALQADLAELGQPILKDLGVEG